MYPLTVDAKNHEMTSVSRSPRVQEGTTPQEVMMTCVAGMMAVVTGKVVTCATVFSEFGSDGEVDMGVRERQL